MSVTNVERLVQDLSVEQLVQIQKTLRHEVEKKREELRQMVGRRYRDVLDASNTVKRLTEIAFELVELLADTRQSTSLSLQKSAQQTTLMAVLNLAAKKESSRRLILLYGLLPMTFTSSDILSRVFSLRIADSLQRTLTSEQHHFLPPQHSSINNANDVGISVRELLELFIDQLLQCRIQLMDSLLEKLGIESNWQSVAGLLVAYALIKPQINIGELLQLYLQARMDMIVASLSQPESTLLGVIREMKETVQCVEQTFGGGQALHSAIQCVNVRGWCPVEIQQLVDDQPLSTSRLLEAEIENVNNIYKIVEFPSKQQVETTCAEWVVKMCFAASERVRAMCTYFERVDQAVEFAVSVSQIFKSDWPIATFTTTEPHVLIYRQLFGDALLQRLQHLINQELHQIEQYLHQRLSQTNCQPPALFHKRTIATPNATVKFDTQLAAGVLPDFQQLVQTVSTQLHQLHQCVHRYTVVGQEESVATLHDVLAEEVLAMVERLTDFKQWQLLSELAKTSPLSIEQDVGIDSASPSANINILSLEDERERRINWLRLFRLLLAFVQHEPSMLCQCMNRNLEKIVRCNRALHTATEQALCHLMDCIIDDCQRTTNFKTQMLECSGSWQRWLDILQEPEQVQLSETVCVQVPTQISRHIYIFLATISNEINQNYALGHLFTWNVTLHVSKCIGSILSELLIKCAESCVPMPLICIGLLLDCKALFLMFPDKKFLDAAQQLEAKLDSIELSVIQESLSRNAKLFAQRTAMLFAQLQAEPITAFNNSINKESQQLQPSYSALIDIMPKVNDVHRLTQIPRLSKLKEENQQAEESLQEKLSKANVKTGHQKKGSYSLLGAAESTVSAHLPTKGASSFSSLYDKISTGWFKG